MLSTALPHGSRLIQDGRRITRLVAALPGLDAAQRSRLANDIAAFLAILVISGSRCLAYLVAGPVNGWLDQVLAVAPLWGNSPL